MEDTAADSLERMLARSDQLHERLLLLFGPANFDEGDRVEATVGMCSVAMEHALSLRTLMAMGLPISAVSLMRLQFEAVVRSMWLQYAAKESELAKMASTLDAESEQLAGNLPSLQGMMDALQRKVGSNLPPAAYDMLARFRQTSWKALNSYVHSGLHPLRRNLEGFPVELALQLVRNSNGLLTMTGMMLAILTGDPDVVAPVAKIQPEFADCLPDLVAG